MVLSYRQSTSRLTNIRTTLMSALRLLSTPLKRGLAVRSYSSSSTPTKETPRMVFWMKSIEPLLTILRRRKFGAVSSPFVPSTQPISMRETSSTTSDSHQQISQQRFGTRLSVRASLELTLEKISLLALIPMRDLLARLFVPWFRSGYRHSSFMLRVARGDLFMLLLSEAAYPQIGRETTVLSSETSPSRMSGSLTTFHSTPLLHVPLSPVVFLRFLGPQVFS